MRKSVLFRLLPISVFTHLLVYSFAQNVGVGVAFPLSKLHIKGSENASQLIIDANIAQSNVNPLIRLRKSDGTDLMWIHSDNVNNVFIGVDAGLLNNTGVGAYYNTFIGKGAGRSNFTGNYNTALGYNAFYTNTVGTYNTSLGTESLYYNVGNYNSALGHQSLCFNTVGTRNTASGFQSLYANDRGNENTANGYRALYSNTYSNHNTAIGSNALYTQSYSNGGTDWNTNNVAVGYEALYANQPTSTTSGLNNAAVGSYALHENTTGHSNAASGYSALYSNTIGHHNTALGYNALFNNIGGNDNTALGALSGTATYATDVWNTISIGNAGWLNGYQNQAFIGNSSTGWIGGWVDWTTYSDARIKNDVCEDVKGLDFINRLRPVTYFRSIKAAKDISGDKDTKDYPGKYDVEKTKYSGFLAQEVEKAAKESNYDFSGVHPPRDEHDLYSLTYAEFVVPLVKGMQEQQAIIENQQSQIDQLKSTMNNLQSAMEKLQGENITGNK